MMTPIGKKMIKGKKLSRGRGNKKGRKINQRGKKVLTFLEILEKRSEMKE